MGYGPFCKDDHQTQGLPEARPPVSSSLTDGELGLLCVCKSINTFFLSFIYFRIQLYSCASRLQFFIYFQPWTWIKCDNQRRPCFTLKQRACPGPVFLLILGAGRAFWPATGQHWWSRGGGRGLMELCFAGPLASNAAWSISVLSQLVRRRNVSG